MTLSAAQRSIIERARAVGGGGQGVALSGAACSYVLAVIAGDLGVTERFPELPAEVPPFFGDRPIDTLEVPDVHFIELADRLFSSVPDADTYFASLAKLHKARLKYERILETQPIPTVEQVGPRALLEFGKLGGEALAAFLFWRKWIYDIDNRAAQETGYLFEPIIAGAIGGTPVSAGKSPVRRHNNPKKGRQVDCIAGSRAYEFKLRVTIAASGQGRWKEEMTFPRECQESGYTPVLVVLDATPNPKLAEVERAFYEYDGEVYIGEDAWAHLDEAAGETMGIYLEKYVHGPIDTLLEQAPRHLPNLTLSASARVIKVGVGSESFVIDREPEEESGHQSLLPDDIDEELPGL